MSWIIFFQQIQEINELTSFLLNIQNKKYAVFPIRTSLEILTQLEDFVRSKEKNQYFEFLETEDYKNFMGDEYPINIKSLKKKKSCYNRSLYSRISGYDIYKKMSGVVHGNSFASRIISKNRNMYYAFFLLHMIKIQLALFDLLWEIQDKFTTHSSKAKEKKFLQFLERYEKISNFLTSSFQHP
jgi:hypothetical protein